MKKGTWISIIPGLISLSLSLGLVLILSNWTAFVLLRWFSYLLFLIVAAFGLIAFFILNHWLIRKFESLSEQERIGIYIALGAFSTFVSLAQFPDSQSTFMTWATLMLASIAFVSIMYSMDQTRRNERLRKEDREENERLREEEKEERMHRLQSNTLDLIHDWATAVNKYIFFVDRPVSLDMTFTIRAKLLEFSVKGSGVMHHSTIFGEELFSLMKVVIDNIGGCIDFKQ